MRFKPFRRASTFKFNKNHRHAEPFIYIYIYLELGFHTNDFNFSAR